MPARNIHHDAVVAALQADGWTITDDPLRVAFGGRDLHVDLGAESLAVGAERAGRRIAVEIQSFLGASAVHDLHDALGQYEVYRVVLSETDPGRTVWLAVPERAWEGILSERLGRLLTERLAVRLMVFADAGSRVLRWIEPPSRLQQATSPERSSGTGAS